MHMLSQLAGNQWYEGDVSCSVVRRVALPGICFATEGLLITLQRVLDGLQVDTNRMADEVNRELPFVMTSRLLMAAVRAGMGREKAHRILQEQSKRARATMGATINSLGEHPLVAALAEAADFALDHTEILRTITHTPLWGRAASQVDSFIKGAESSNA